MLSLKAISVSVNIANSFCGLIASPFFLWGVYMFSAYSIVKGRVIDISEAYDLQEIFTCPEPFCDAKFSIRGVTGNRAKHFARLPSSTHRDDCPYATSNMKYLRQDALVKSSINEIFNNIRTNSRETNTTGTCKILNTLAKNNDSNRIYIHTVKQLLDYCQINRMEEEYLPGITVDDIILDSRNLQQAGRFRGIQGRRLVVGVTLKSESKNTLYLVVRAKTKLNKTLTLHVATRMDSKLLKEIKQYFFETNQKLEGHTVAIFEDWKIDRDYWISCVVSNKSHVVFRK